MSDDESTADPAETPAETTIAPETAPADAPPAEPAAASLVPEGVESSLPSDSPQIHLPEFDGPLDLLLYLIRRDKVDIRDLEIAPITHRYMEYLDLMQELNLDVAGEFMVMAATLI